MRTRLPDTAVRDVRANISQGLQGLASCFSTENIKQYIENIHAIIPIGSYSNMPVGLPVFFFFFDCNVPAPLVAIPVSCCTYMCVHLFATWYLYFCFLAVCTPNDFHNLLGGF